MKRRIAYCISLFYLVFFLSGVEGSYEATPVLWGDGFLSSPIPSSFSDFFENPILENQKFLWKNYFFMNDGNSLEDEHMTLHSHLREFRRRIQNLSDEETVEIVKNVILGEQGHIEEKIITDTFLKLKTQGKTVQSFIGQKLFKEDSFQENNYIGRNIRKIILDNFKNFKEGRNLCVGSFSIIRQSEKLPPLPIQIDGKLTIFFSGITNQLIRILEKHPTFATWSYVTFQRNGNEISINKRINDTSREKIILEENLKEHFGYGSERMNDDHILQYNFQIKHLLQKIKVADKKETENAMHELLTYYGHSEQALRLFLLEQIHDLLAGSISPLDILILNLHTERDPCPRCTQTLFLETMIHEKSPGVDILTKTFGFFQRFNFSQIFGNAKTSSSSLKTEEEFFPQDQIPSPYIFVSSSMLESQESIGKRLLCGIGQLKTPIHHPSHHRLFLKYNGPYFTPEFTSVYQGHVSDITEHSEADEAIPFYGS